MPTAARIRIRDVLNRANPNDLPDALRMTKIGDQITPIKATFAALSAAAAQDITTAAAKTAATITGITLADGENLPAIGQVSALRVTAVGTGNVGPRMVTDAGGTPLASPAGPLFGVALLSDDGKTLTFEGTVTGFVLEYFPRPAVSTDGLFAGEGA